MTRARTRDASYLPNSGDRGFGVLHGFRGARRLAGLRRNPGLYRTVVLLSLTVLAIAMAPSAFAQWAAQPGETQRNAFGPSKRGAPKVCRGACGVGCPSTCEEAISYECMDETRLRRVKTYECGTHLGCRQHDDCLDACAERGSGGAECQLECHEAAVDEHGLQNATSWARGHGPYDESPIRFEYTRDAPGEPEAAFRCPDGARRTCDGVVGRCIAAGGTPVEPVFDAFAVAGDAAMRVSGFRAGRLCGGSVCEETRNILVTGNDTCHAGRCTRYGVEFDYANADPSAPLECDTTTDGGKKDFVGDLISKGLRAMPEREDEPGEGGSGEGEHGMKALLGAFKKVVESADSPEDVRISFAPLDEDGNPIESKRVGNLDAGPQSTPKRVDLNGPSGHLVVPMYQLVDAAGHGPMVREIRCTHKGTPVFEATFHLSF